MQSCIHKLKFGIKLELLWSGSSVIHKQQEWLRFGIKKAHSAIPGVNETQGIWNFPSEVQSLICRTGTQNYPLDLLLFPSLLATIKQCFQHFIFNLIYL